MAKMWMLYILVVIKISGSGYGWNEIGRSGNGQSCCGWSVCGQNENGWRWIRRSRCQRIGYRGPAPFHWLTPNKRFEPVFSTVIMAVCSLFNRMLLLTDLIPVHLVYCGQTVMIGCNRTSFEWTRAVRHIYGIIRHMQGLYGKKWELDELDLEEMGMDIRLIPLDHVTYYIQPEIKQSSIIIIINIILYNGDFAQKYKWRSMLDRGQQT